MPVSATTTTTTTIPHQQTNLAITAAPLPNAVLLPKKKTMNMLPQTKLMQPLLMVVAILLVAQAQTEKVVAVFANALLAMLTVNHAMKTALSATLLCGAMPAVLLLVSARQVACTFSLENAVQTWKNSAMKPKVLDVHV